MKKIITAALLAAALLISAAAPSFAFNPFSSRTVAGYETFARAEQLSPGLTLTKLSGWDGDSALLSGYTIEWDTADSTVEPRLTFGEGIYGRDTLTDMAAYERTPACRSPGSTPTSSR